MMTPETTCSLDPIKSDIISVEDLTELLSTFFGICVGRWISTHLMHLLSIDKVNQIHRDNLQYRGATFAHHALQHPLIDIKYRLHGEGNLDALTGRPFVTVSNHPLGGLDGIMLLDIVGHKNPTYKVLVNDILGRVGALQDSFITVHPRQNRKKYVHNPSKNISGLLAIAEQLRAGHPIGLFPAGGVGDYDFKHDCPKEQKWQLGSVRIIQRAQTPVLPIYFAGHNSKLFYLLRRISYLLNTVRTPAEIFNKKGMLMEIAIGNPIPAEEIARHQNIRDLRDFLMRETMAQKQQIDRHK